MSRGDLAHWLDHGLLGLLLVAVGVVLHRCHTFHHRIR